MKHADLLARADAAMSDSRLMDMIEDLLDEVDNDSIVNGQPITQSQRIVRIARGVYLAGFRRGLIQRAR